MEIRGTRAEEQDPRRPFSRLPALSVNYVKREGQSAAGIDSHRRMFYGAYYFRDERSSSGPTELFEALHASERLDRDDLSGYASDHVNDEDEENYFPNECAHTFRA